MSTNPKLPDSFDVIICGTGLPESMVAASLSRAGKKVLHVDKNDYYGSQWSTFTFESLLNWVQRNQEYEEREPEETLSENNIPLMDFCIKNIVIKSFLPEKSEVLDCLDKESLLVTSSNNQENFDIPLIDKMREDHDIKGSDCEVIEAQSSRVSYETNNDCSTDTTEGECDVHSTSDEEGIITSNNHGADTVGNMNKSKEPLSMVSQARIKQNSKDISLEDFKVLSRKFNLDITPKFLFSAGPLVKSIIKANITHYMEFKVVNRLLTFKDDQIIEVPCNRSDVFSCNFLSMIEKRMLMKFLTFCLEPDAEDISSFNGKPFKEFLESHKLSENLQKFVIYSIAMVKSDVVAEVGLKETQRFLKSLGLYGKSPFIWPLYGIGELPQAFCRMSAVFGGTYCLKMDLESIEIDKSDKIIIKMDGEEIGCEHVVMESSYVPLKYRVNTYKMISRAILITNSSLLPAAEEHLSFLTIAPLSGKKDSIRVVELGPASSACPNGLYVLYLSCNSSCTAAEEDLVEYVNMLTTQIGNDELNPKPRLLWSIYFNQVDDVSFENIANNIYITSMPDSSLGFDKAVEEAKCIFHSICPDEEFMLAVPNAEDIVWGDDESEKNDNNTVECSDDNKSEINDSSDGFNNSEPTQEEIKNGFDDEVSQNFNVDEVTNVNPGIANDE